MKLRDLTIAVPLFFEAVMGSAVKWWYLQVWVYTYGWFPRRHNIKTFVWVTSRPSFNSLVEHFNYRRKVKYEQNCKNSGDESSR